MALTSRNPWSFWLLAALTCACGDARRETGSGPSGPDHTPDGGSLDASGSDASSPGSASDASEPSDPSDAAAQADGSSGGADAGDGDAPEPFELKVLSFNSWSGSVESVASDIASTGAQVVGVQEITPSEAENIVAALGEGWRFVQEDRANTFAILTRLEVLARVGVTEATRGGVGATLELHRGVRVHVFNTHLHWTPYGPYQLSEGMSVEEVVESENQVRMPALRELLDMSEPHVASPEPTFLVGDFNAPSHLDYAPDMPWPTSVAPIEAGYRDSYRELHPENEKKWACEFAIDDPGITWTRLPSVEPHGCYDRIDFVYYSAGDARPVTSVELSLESSDHRAVLSTFSITPPERSTRAGLGLPRHESQGAPRHPLLSWVPARGAMSETLTLEKDGAEVLTVELDDSKHLPRLLLPGSTYQWRVDSVTASGTVRGDTWQFTTRTGGGLEPDKRRYAPGETMHIAFDGADAAKDWVALHPATTAYGQGAPGTAWQYTNGSQSAPAQPVQSGTLTFTAPVAAGAYVLRFFHDDGYTVEDELRIVVE